MTGFLAAATVHTTGINWDAVFTIAASVVVLLSPVLTVLFRFARISTKDAIREVIAKEVLPRFDKIAAEIDALHAADAKLDNRLTRLEGVEEGKQSLLAMQKQGNRVTDETHRR